MASDWPTPTYIPPIETVSTFRSIILAYHNALNRRGYGQKFTSQKDWESFTQLLDFVTNDNLFEVTLSDDTPLPLAPLIVCSMLFSPSPQFRSLFSKRWETADLLIALPLSNAHTSADRFLIGLYIRLRNFFATFLSVKENIPSIWDYIFCMQTGYNDSYMIDTDGKPNTFMQDRWADEAVFCKWYQEPVCNSVLFPNLEHPHTEVYHWIQQEESHTGKQTSKQFFLQQIRRHPSWVTEYRKLRSIPTHTATIESFCKRCMKQCPDHTELIKRIPAYPYTDSRPGPNQLHTKGYLIAVFETCLQAEMVKDSTHKLFKIRQRLFSPAKDKEKHPV